MPSVKNWIGLNRSYFFDFENCETYFSFASALTSRRDLNIAAIADIITYARVYMPSPIKILDVLMSSGSRKQA